MKCPNCKSNRFIRLPEMKTNPAHKRCQDCSCVFDFERRKGSSTVRANPIVGIHPMSEIIEKKLFGFSTVPEKEQRRMISRAIKAACAGYDELLIKVEELEIKSRELEAELEAQSGD